MQNWEPVKNVIATVLSAIGGIFVSKGWVDNSTMLQIVGAIVSVLGIAWSAWKGTATQLINTTDQLPNVKGVVVDVPTAMANPSPTIVAPSAVNRLAQ